MRTSPGRIRLSQKRDPSMGVSVSVYEMRFTSYSLFYELVMMPCHHMAAVAVSGLNLSSSFFLQGSHKLL